MASNPNNAVGTNGAFGGRTSVNAFNDVLSVFNGRGIVQGWNMAPDSGMNITIGGDGSNRDVAIAQDNIGNKTTINNISEQPIPLTIPAAPATNSRIDAVVAYVDNPAEGSATATDNYGACGLIVVSGTAASSPVAPTEADIRTAITADGGAGTVAYYVVLGTVRVATGTTDIDASMLTKGAYAGVSSNNISDGAITSSKLASNAVTTAKINNSAVTSSKIDWTTLKPRWKVVSTSTNNTVTIPSGYRLYKLTFKGTVSSSDSWGILISNNKSGTSWAYGQGVRNGSWFSEEFTAQSADKYITCGGGASVGSGLQLTKMTLSRKTTSTTEFNCVYENSFTGSNSYNTGRGVFNISSGTSDWVIQSECTDNKWVVEAFDE